MDFLLPVLAALFLWWFGTGAVFWLAGRGIDRARTRGTMAGATVALGGALLGLEELSDDTRIGAAYLSFACGIVAWGWLEIGFLLGHVTGPRTAPCPPGARGMRRFLLAVGTILWHELAILGLGTAMIALTWGMANQVGTWTFVLLMAMRVSAKLNLFLGVPHPPTVLLPAHLSHMGSFFRQGPITVLMPAVITGATALATLVAWRAADPSLDAFHVTAYMLFWTLLVLGIAEHWFLILPVQESALWRWFLETKPEGRGKASPACAKSTGRGYLGDSFPGTHRPEEDGAPVLAALKPHVQGGMR